MKPYKHQQDIIDLGRNRLGLWCECGTGKTATSLWCMEKLNRNMVLIITPLIVFQKWIDDIQDIHGEPLRVIQHVKKRYATVEYTDKTFFVMTKEHFKLKCPDTLHVDGVIVDEAHYFAGIKSQMAKKLYAFLSQFPIDELSVYLLSATPYLSTPWNVYTLGKHVGASECNLLGGLHWEYHTFRREMFYPMKMGRRTIWEPRKNATQLLQPYIHALGVFVRVEDVIKDLPAQIETLHQVELTSEQEDAIKDIDATEPIVRFTKQHQIENGYIPAELLAERPLQRIPTSKLEWIREYVSRNPKTAIVCRYTEQLRIIEDYLKSLELSTVILDGNTKKRDTVIAQARASTATIMIIQASVSEGYDLPEYEHCIFASLDWSYKNYVQMKGRFLRVNAPTQTDFHILLSGEVDRRVLKAVKNKQDFYV